MQLTSPIEYLTCTLILSLNKKAGLNKPISTNGNIYWYSFIHVVIINDKIVTAIKQYLKERETYKHKDSEYLFISRESGKVNNTVINRIFNKYSDKITPHTLRHFFCSYALENGLSVHEVASQAGHSNIHTTLIYTNPSREEIKRKINLL